MQLNESYTVIQCNVISPPKNNFFDDIWLLIPPSFQAGDNGAVPFDAVDMHEQFMQT